MVLAFKVPPKWTDTGLTPLASNLTLVTTWGNAEFNSPNLQNSLKNKWLEIRLLVTPRTKLSPSPHSWRSVLAQILTGDADFLLYRSDFP